MTWPQREKAQIPLTYRSQRPNFERERERKKKKKKKKEEEEEEAG